MKTRLLIVLLLLLGIAESMKGQEVVVDGVKYRIAAFSSVVHGYTKGIINANIVENVTYDSKTYPVTFIDPYAFQYCTSLQNITIPNSITSIGHDAFQGCVSLQSITVPNSVTSIDYYAFKGCTSLQSVTIPNSVTSIGHDAFQGCTSLESISLPNNLSSISSSTFAGCSILKGIDIPNSVTSIGHEAFQGCVSLQSITVPNSVTSIGYSAFQGCVNLRPINLSTNLSLIEYSAFSGCDALTLIYIPKNVTDIGNNAFGDIKYLQSVYCESSRPMGEFNNYTATLHIPKGASDAYRQSPYWSGFFTEGTVVEGDWSRFTKDGLQYICNGDKITASVAQCDLSASGEVVVPERITTDSDKDYTVTAIETGAFRNCEGITVIKFHENIQEIGNYAFKNCAGLKSVTIPNKITRIQGGVFDGCKALTKITFPATLKSIEKEAFANDSSLENIVLPDKVNYVGESAFNGCTSLKRVYMSERVIEIGESAFQGCSGIESIEVRGSVPPKICYNTFHNYRATLYVPIGSKSAYQAAEYWEYFTNIVEGTGMSIGSVDSEQAVYYADGTLFLQGIDTPAWVTVYTPEGKCVHSCSMLADEDSCDFSMLVDGIYIVRICTGDKTVNIKLLK